MKQMVFLVMFLLVLTSCKKDSNNPVATGDSGLIGTWNLSSISGSTPQGTITIPPTTAGISMTMIFNSNNTASMSMVQQGVTTNQDFKWSTTNGNVSLTPTIGGTASILPYTLTGNKASVNFSSIIPGISYNGVTVTNLVFEFTKQ